MTGDGTPVRANCDVEVGKPSSKGPFPGSTNIQTGRLLRWGRVRAVIELRADFAQFFAVADANW
jgi:hypothetical protein